MSATHNLTSCSSDSIHIAIYVYRHSMRLTIPNSCSCFSGLVINYICCRSSRKLYLLTMLRNVPKDECNLVLWKLHKLYICSSEINAIYWIVVDYNVVLYMIVETYCGFYTPWIIQEYKERWYADPLLFLNSSYMQTQICF